MESPAGIARQERKVKQQVNSLMEYIVSSVDVTKVVDRLATNKTVISRAGREVINGNPTALVRCRYLLKFLARSSSSPYCVFRTALHECGYRDVVRRVDEEWSGDYEYPQSPSRSGYTLIFLNVLLLTLSLVAIATS